MESDINNNIDSLVDGMKTVVAIVNSFQSELKDLKRRVARLEAERQDTFLPAEKDAKSVSGAIDLSIGGVLASGAVRNSKSKGGAEGNVGESVIETEESGIGSDCPEEAGEEKERDAEPAEQMLLFGNPESADSDEKEYDTVNDGLKPHKTVKDSISSSMAWKYENPGPKVRDIRSAISLNDRVLFINTLFGKDNMLYEDTIRRLNAESDPDRALEYLRDTFPEWDTESKEFYYFMMAVRRKIR